MGQKDQCNDPKKPKNRQRIIQGKRNDIPANTPQEAPATKG
jgi:hypothetical protein